MIVKTTKHKKYTARPEIRIPAVTLVDKGLIQWKVNWLRSLTGSNTDVIGKETNIPEGNAQEAVWVRDHEALHSKFSPHTRTIAEYQKKIFGIYYEPATKGQENLVFLQAWEDYRLGILAFRNRLEDMANPYKALDRATARTIRFGGNMELACKLVPASTLFVVWLCDAFYHTKEDGRGELLKMIMEKSPTFAEALRLTPLKTMISCLISEIYSGETVFSVYRQAWLIYNELLIKEGRKEGEYEKYKKYKRGKKGKYYTSKSETGNPYLDSCSFKIERPPLTVDLGKEEFKRLHRRLTMGLGVFRHVVPYLLGDVNRSFGLKRTQSKKFRMAIDCSGSMAIKTEELKRVVEVYAKRGIEHEIGIYGANGEEGTLFIVAKNGMIYGYIRGSMCGGANGVDYHVLQWLGEGGKDTEKIWVSDGGVTGLNDTTFESITEGCKELAVKHEIVQIINAECAIDYITKGNTDGVTHNIGFGT